MGKNQRLRSVAGALSSSFSGYGTLRDILSFGVINPDKNCLKVPFCRDNQAMIESRLPTGGWGETQHL